MSERETTGRAPARTGLVGHPSDGYEGAVVSLALPRFEAAVTLTHADIRPEVGVRDLVDAAALEFRRWARAQRDVDVVLPAGASATTNVPREVGLAGSSALVIATMRAMERWSGLSVPADVMASMALHAERSLGIAGGLQDRVVQCRGGAVHMDFAPSAAHSVGGYPAGTYRTLQADRLPPLFIAWRASGAESSSVVHSDLRERWERGDSGVVTGMRATAALAHELGAALDEGPVEASQLGGWFDRGLELRQSMVALRPEHLELVDVAASLGVSVNYTGSGGAVVGAWPAEHATQAALRHSLEAIGASVEPVG